MSLFAYLFEIRSIQPFLFASGKLKDMVQASELIDYLCHEPLQKALEVCGLTGSDEPESPRRAGGAVFLLINDEQKAIRFRRIWPVMVRQLLPGVRLTDALVRAEGAQQGILKGLESYKYLNKPGVPLPQASSLAFRYPRTGLVAVERIKGEAVDEATSVQRQFKRPEGLDESGLDNSQKLEQRFSIEEGIHWPNNFEPEAYKTQRFPLRENNMVGLVHIDGNGLGEILRVLNAAAKDLDDEAYISLYREFSEGLDQANTAAAAQASEYLVAHKNEYHVIPARPLVLGGDDLTIIVRDDLALEFSTQFIQAFEYYSAHFLTDLKALMRSNRLPDEVIQSLPDKLTACAGVTFMKASQPFAQCYGLTESLCGQAKTASRQQRESVPELKSKGIIPSSIAFYKVQSSLIEDANSLFAQEMVAQSVLKEEGRPEIHRVYELGLKVYLVDVPVRDAAGTVERDPTGQVLYEANITNLPRLSDLHYLSQQFGHNKLNDSALRKMATQWYSNVGLTGKQYQRWQELADDKSAGQSSQKALQNFKDGLKAILSSSEDNLPCRKVVAGGDQSYGIDPDYITYQSPLVDLLVYLGLQSGRLDLGGDVDQSDDLSEESSNKVSDQQGAASQ